MSLSVTTAPAIEPVTLDEAKAWLRHVEDADDILLTDLLLFGRRLVEQESRRQLITATYTLTMDQFPPAGRFLEIPRPPLQSITSIAYLDTSGASQTWDSSLYQVDTGRTPGRVAPIETEDWPDTQEATFGTVTVVYTAGFGDAAADVPAEYKTAIKIYVLDYFENRESILTGTIQTQLPTAATLLLRRFGTGDYQSYRYLAS